MATSDILGLFATPEQYQAQQQANEQQRAFNFAQLSPRDQAVYGMFLGGQQLGRGIGGLLGAQDPQLRMISQRQEIMQSINPADPESLTAGIRLATERGDQQLALTLTDYRNKQLSEMAQAQQRMAAANKERLQSVPADIAKARELGVLTTALNALEATPKTPERDQKIAMLRTQISALDRPEKVTPDMSNAMALADLASADRNSAEWKTTYQTQLTRLTTKPENVRRSEFAQALVESGLEEGSPEFKEKMAAYATKKLADKDEKDISFGADREAISSEMFEGKRFKNLTPEQQARVNARKKLEDQGKVPRTEVKNVLGTTKVVDIPAFRIQLANATKPFGETIDAGDLGISLMNNAIKTNNFASFESARTNLAKMVDPGRLTNADIERAGVDPAVLSRAKDFISRAFTSTPSEATMKDMIATMKLIRKAARVKYDRELKVQRDLAKESGIPPASISTIFADIRRSEDKPEPGKGDVRDFNTLPK